MVKVCMIVPSFNAKGGITSVVNGYIDGIDNNLFKIKFVETYCDGNRIKKALKALKGYIIFVWLLFFWNPDLIHIHSSFGASFYRKKPIIDICFFLKKPIINHIHGSDYHNFYENATITKKRVIEKTYNKCNIIIALSTDWKKTLSNIISPNKIIILNNYSIIRKTQPKDKKNNTVLFLGFLTYRKGIFDIPLVIEQVKRVIPNIKFILAGSSNFKEEKKLRQIIQTKSLQDNVVLPGWVTDKEKKKCLEQADLFILPSYSEGMPMSILDAMGYALPIISTKVGGIGEIVKNNFNGYLFEPGDISGFSSSIIKLLSNDKLRKRMGANSIKMIERGYSRDIHLKKISSIYMSLIGRSKKV